MLTWTFNHLLGFLPRASTRPSLPAPAQTIERNASIESRSPAIADNPHLAARRAQALRSLYPKLSSWFGSRRDALCIGEINEYLAQASNVTDLEQRIRVIERQRHFS